MGKTLSFSALVGWLVGFSSPDRSGHLHLQGGEGVLLRHEAAPDPLQLPERAGRPQHQHGVLEEVSSEYAQKVSVGNARICFKKMRILSTNCIFLVV